MAKFLMKAAFKLACALVLFFWFCFFITVLGMMASSYNKANAMLNPLSPMSPMNPSNLSSPMNPANPAGVYSDALYGEDTKKKEQTPVKKMEQADKDHPGQNFLKTMMILLSVFIICSVMYFLI